MIIAMFVAAFIGISGWISSAQAQHVIVLKNGRQITVQSYREEGSMIKFQGFGGEIGISKDQLQSVRRVGVEGASGLNVTAPERVQPSASPETTPEPSGAEKPLTPEENRAKQEREYVQKLSELTDQLKETRDRYSQTIRETTSSEPNLLVSEKQVSARSDDVVARFKEAQSNPSEPAPVKLLEPSPFSSLPPTTTEVRPSGRTTSPYDPPPSFTENQQELLDLRNRALELEKERDRLINEMRQKNLGAVKILE